MKIYPHFQGGNDFMILLSVQELQNLQEGLVARRENSPWNNGTIRQINKALTDRAEYTSKVWDERI